MVIFRLSPKIDVILVNFSPEIVWPEATEMTPIDYNGKQNLVYIVSSEPPEGCNRREPHSTAPATLNFREEIIYNMYMLVIVHNIFFHES